MLLQHVLLVKFALSEMSFFTAKAHTDPVLSYGNLMNERGPFLNSEEFILFHILFYIGYYSETLLPL